MKKRFFLIVAAVVLLCGAAWAVPAKPGLITVTQSDGTSLQIQMLGDEFHHNLATADGLTIERGNDGNFYYCSANGITSMRAHDAKTRGNAELEFLAQHIGQFTMLALAQAKKDQGKMLSRSSRTSTLKVGDTQVPTMGSPRVPIILVQYTDKLMSNTKAQLQAHYTSDEKSVYQYFADQSNGLYTPQYDVYGIYNLPNNRSYYGGSAQNGRDDKPATMVGDAINAAGNDIDWSLYDNNNDGMADVCIVVYAGVGQAQAYYSVPQSVWPCQWSLSSGEYYGDGTGAQIRNGVTIDKFAVFNEVGGSNDNGTTLDGIGTFCHEFSHCLGLPDFYDTDYGGHYGMGSWSLMDGGCYNGGMVSGDTPIGYSAYEKNYMGWIDYIIPENNTKYTMPVFNAKNSETDKAIKITGFNDNEYWILENRRSQGWDAYIADEGLLITHFTYIQSRWEENTTNDYDIQLATIIPADNTLSEYSEDTDLFGNSNNSFTGTSIPAMKANMSANGNLASSTGGAGTISDKEVTYITINNDETVSLWYNKDAIVKVTPQLTDTTDITSTSFTAVWDEVENAVSYTLQVSDVNYVPPVMLLGTIDGSAYPGSYTNITLPYPWGGSNVKGGNNAVYFSTGSFWGTSPGNITFTIPEGYDNSTFTMKITTVSGTYGSGNLTVATPQTAAVGHNFNSGETYAWVVTASTDEKITITSTEYSYSPDMSLIEVYSGDATQEFKAPNRATETGDANMRLITGIVGNSYNVTGLNENGLYNVKVRALYTDEMEGDWSDVWQVQLHAQQSSWKIGDVNLDGAVDIEDVNIIINIILGVDSADNYDSRAYLTDDDVVDIDDVNMVINIILNQNNN